MPVKPPGGIILALAVVCIGLSIAACAPASLGSAPASERILKCSSHETLVCRTRDTAVRRLGDEEPEYDFCTCETLDDGLWL
ncbi:MAG: hypothetical protein L0Y45_09930 [Woeseiaceae bacterium]|nr:hypothetical protein [Woeseiaceae bacterium]